MEANKRLQNYFMPTLQCQQHPTTLFSYSGNPQTHTHTPPSPVFVIESHANACEKLKAHSLCTRWHDVLRHDCSCLSIYSTPSSSSPFPFCVFWAFCILHVSVYVGQSRIILCYYILLFVGWGWGMWGRACSGIQSFNLCKENWIFGWVWGEIFRLICVWWEFWEFNCKQAGVGEKVKSSIK